MKRSAYPESDAELQRLLEYAVLAPSYVTLDYLGVDVRKARDEAEIMARERLIDYDTAFRHCVMEQLEEIKNG